MNGRLVAEALVLTVLSLLVFVISPLFPAHDGLIDECVSAWFFVMGFWLLLGAKRHEAPAVLIKHGMLIILLTTCLYAGVMTILRGGSDGLFAMMNISVWICRVLAASCALSLRIVMRLKAMP